MTATASDDTVEEGESTTVQWRSSEAEQCAWRKMTNDAKVVPPLEPVPLEGEETIRLEETTVVTFRCERGEDVTWADLRIHVRPAPAPLTGPDRPSAIPVGFAARAGFAPDTPLGTGGVAAGFSLLVNPDLGRGSLVGPFGWRIGTPYILSVLRAPDGMVLHYVGVGARVGLTVRRLEITASATTGPALGLLFSPGLTLSGGLATDARLTARWRPSRHLLVGLWTGVFGAIALDAGTHGFEPRLRWFPSVGVEVLLGLGAR